MVLAAGVVVLAASAAGLLTPAAASADPAVVSATIYTGSQAGTTSQTVTVAGLSNCPTYSGASPFLLNPGSTPYQPAAGGSWSLDTIVECGLQIPAASLTDVAVRSPVHGFETPLAPPDLADPSRYQDPTAPGALPVVSLDNGQVTYARPERSASDANGSDSFAGSGPVTIAVYENAPPLQVRASARRLSVSPTALRKQFAATVTDAAGRTPAPAGLSWSWSFGDGSGSGHATPTHAFALGRWFVTVTVVDRANGTGGTDTIPVSVDSRALAGTADRAGAGKHRTSPSPSGVVTGAGPTSGHRRPRPRPRRHASSGSPQTSAARQLSTPGTVTTPPAATTTPAATTPATAARRPPAAHPRRLVAHRPPTSRRRRLRRITRARSSGAGPIVRGLLIADVTPVAPAASPLSQAVPAVTSAPAIVRSATRSAAGFSGLIAAGLVVALLALGAAREHRGRRRGRELPSGP